MSLHPDSDRLGRAIVKCLGGAISWSGVLYRSSSPRYANKDDILTGIGSKTVGGRWNSPNSFQTLYTSLDPHTAVDEALAHFRHFGLAIAKAMPRVIVSLESRLQAVLDLTNGKVRRLVGVSEQRLIEEPWRQKQTKGREALTQAIGRHAFSASFEGILVPSAARKNGINLIIFPAKINPPASWLKIIHQDELPLSFPS